MNKYSLLELAELVDIQPRTVRSYIEKGLMPGPEASGRYAYYGPHHLIRLKAIKVMRAIDDLSLNEIRRRLLTLAAREIEEISERLDDWRTTPERKSSEQLSSALDYVRSAREDRALHVGSPLSSGPDVSSAVVQNEKGRGREDLRTEKFSLRERFSKLRNRQRSSAHTAETVAPGDVPEQLASIERADGLNRHADEHENALEEASPVGDFLDRLERFDADSAMIPKKSTAQPNMQISVTPDVDIVVRGVSDREQIARLERVADFLRYILMGSGTDERK